MKEKQGQRLREMAEAKRFNRINDLENEIRDLEMLIQRLRNAAEHDIVSILAKTVHTSQQEVESALLKATQSLRKAKGEPVESVEKLDPFSENKYNLISIPDEMLTPEQVLCFLLLNEFCSYNCINSINFSLFPFLERIL